MSSTPALAGHDKGLAFTVAKAGVMSLTKALAFELAPFVRVNTVALGNVENSWTLELSKEELLLEMRISSNGLDHRRKSQRPSFSCVLTIHLSSTVRL